MYSCITHGWASHQTMCPICSSTMITTSSSTELKLPVTTNLKGASEALKRANKTAYINTMATPFVKVILDRLSEVDDSEYCECGCKGSDEHADVGRSRLMSEISCASKKQLKQLAKYFSK